MKNHANAYETYANQKVMGATPAELTLMRYDGAIKYCNIAENAIEKKDIEKVHQNLVRVEKIIEYLRATLDMKYPVAQDFDHMYAYLYKRLVEVNISKDVEILQEINEHLHAIRETWVQVMEKNHVKLSEAVGY